MNNSIFGIWNQPWTLAVLSGLFLGLSFPPVDLAILQIPAFIFLFRLADLSATWREMAVKAYVSFFIWNLITTYWLMMATFAGGAAAILANSFLMIIPLLLIRYLLRSRLPAGGTAFFAGATWVTYEFLHHNWDLAWPWLALGNGWSNMINLVQYISWTGYLGISFWIVISAAMLHLAIKSMKRLHFIYAGALLLLFPALSLSIQALWQEDPSGSTEVAVIQPNMNSYLDYGGLDTVDELFTLLFELSDSVRTDQTELVVWPENAIDSLIPRDSRFNSRIRDTLTTWNTELITGAGFIEYYEPGEAPALVRGSIDSNSYNIYNAALHYTGEWYPDIYKKGKLVPIVERMPFAETFQHLDIFNLVNWGEITGYGKGFDANNFRIGGRSTPALICYDSVFSNWVGNFVRNDADFLTIVTNDGWWGDTSGHVQHFAYARLRAVEFRRWIVRSANNGISGIISPDGNVQHATGYWEQTAFTYTIHPSAEMTFYAMFGNWFNWLMFAGTLGGVLVLVRENRDPVTVPAGNTVDEPAEEQLPEI